MIKIFRKISPKKPIVISAWPGMGHVAFKAACYMKDKLKAKLFAALSPDGFFYQTDISIERSLIDVQEMPAGKFYYWQNTTGENDIIFFISEQQPPIEKAVVYAETILDFLKTFKVELIVTFAALISSIEFVKSPKVWIAVTHKELMKDFRNTEARPLEYGQVSGLNGLMLGLAKKKKFKGICLLGEIPFYAAQIENPRSSMVILHVLTEYLNIHIDLTELSIAGKIVEEEIKKLLEHVKKPTGYDETHKPISAEDIESIKNILDSRSHIPNSAKEQIEVLFSNAKKDPSFTLELKKKLDEWNVYKEYEDRFLKLFKKDEKQEDFHG